MQENKICVYAIAKNESQNVDKWADSMLEADCVVVLDTGSSDDTVEKLKSRGIHVVTKIIKPWRFDVARNESMKLVPEDCNILVCTDLDEVFEPGWADVLREKWVYGQTRMCWYKYSWSHDQYGNPDRVFWYNKIHCRGYSWKYIVHELLVDNGTMDMSNMSEIFVDSGIMLHHWPLPKDGRDTYLPLLIERAKEAYAENDEDVMGALYLCHHYAYGGYYKESNDEIDKFIKKFYFSAGEFMISNILLFKGDNYKALGDKEKTEEYYKKAIEKCPTYRDPYISLGEFYIGEGNFESAKQTLLDGIKNSVRRYSWLERSNSFNYHIYDLLDLACYYTGDKKSALAFAEKAYSMCPDDERLKNNVKLIVDTLTDNELCDMMN